MILIFLSVCGDDGRCGLTITFHTPPSIPKEIAVFSEYSVLIVVSV